LRDGENEGFGAGCHLIRMLKKLLQMQDDVVKLPELLAILDPESGDAINRFAFCAQPMPDFEMRISEVPKHEWPRHLITTEVMIAGPDDEQVEADDSPLLFAIIANSRVVDAAEGRRCEYDYPTITRTVLRCIVNGRVPLTMMSDSGPAFYQTLKLKPVVEILDAANQALKLDGKELDDYAQKRVGELSGVSDLNDDDLKLLWVQCAQLRPPWTKLLTDAEMSRLQNDISEMPGEDVTPVVRQLIDVVMFVLGIDGIADTSFGPQSSIGELMNSGTVHPIDHWNPSFSKFCSYKLEALQDLGHKVIAAIPSRDFSTHYGLNDKLPVAELHRLQSIERRMLDEQSEQRAVYFEALTAFASQLHSVIRRISQHESPDRPLSEIDGVQEMLPRVHRPLPLGRGPRADLGGMAKAAPLQFDDGALAHLIDIG
jgi:hypothetical protein